MDVKIIESLIEAFTNAGLTKFSLKCKEFELKLCKDDVVTTIMQPTVASTPVLDTNTDITPIVGKPEMPPDGPGDSYTKMIKAPMAGMFHASASVIDEPFVKVGTHISKGDIVGSIEVMQQRYTIESEIAGEVVEVLARNEEMVELNQPLFVLK